MGEIRLLEYIPKLSEEEVNRIYYNNGTFLGQGAFGAVYKVIKKDVPKDQWKAYALKYMSKVRVIEADMLAEYNLRTILREDCNRGLVCYHDLFETTYKGKEVYGLVMDLIKGIDLLKAVNTLNLSFEHKLMITNDLLQTLKFLHSLNLVHRDIKAGNVVYNFDENPQKSQTILVDYGFTCSLTIEPKIPQCVGHSGTERYRSPELVDAFRNDSYISDAEWLASEVWALGAVIWEVWTVKNFPSENPREVPLKHLDPSVADLVRAMLTYDWQDRPTMNEIKLL